MGGAFLHQNLNTTFIFSILNRKYQEVESNWGGDMKRSPVASWVVKFVNLFRPTPTEAVSPPMKGPSQKIDLEKLPKNSKNSLADPMKVQKDLSSHKARESNVDRYKHPSDFFTSNY